MSIEPFTAEILIVGAGPAGSTLARILAEAGRDVLLVDQRAFPRPKPCGGALPARSLPLLDEDPGGAGGVNIERLELHGALPGPLAFDPGGLRIVDRTLFDARLLERARAAGARFRPRCRLIGMERSKTGFRCTTSHGEVRSRQLAAADGALSPTARLLGVPRPAFHVCLGAMAPRPAAAPADAILDLNALPSGYGWVFPSPNGWNLGLFGPFLPTPRLRRGLRRFVAGLGRRIQGSPTSTFGGVIPDFEPLDWYARNGAFLLGDAARLADPLTGEGIHYALASARLAARAILAGDENLYRRLLEQDLLPELALARRAARRFRSVPAWLLPFWMTLPGFRRQGDLYARLLTGAIDYRELHRKLGRSSG